MSRSKVKSKDFVFLFFLILRQAQYKLKESKNQGSEFLFVCKSLAYKYLQLVANNFNSFLKLKFFNPSADGTEILKITIFSSVAKTKKFKAGLVR